MTGQQKCQSIIPYCSTKVKDFLENLRSYRDNNFDLLIKDIHDYYDVQLADSRYKEKDLIKFVKDRQTRSSHLVNGKHIPETFSELPTGY